MHELLGQANVAQPGRERGPDPGGLGAVDPLEIAGAVHPAQCRSSLRRRLVRRRAAISAGVSALPIPGVVVVSDFHLFGLLINEINRQFGFTPDQIARLQPEMKVLAYRAAAGVGGVMVGRMVTREALAQLMGRAGRYTLGRVAARMLPLAGQVASAAIGFQVFRRIGYAHVEACVQVAQELLAAQPR